MILEIEGSKNKPYYDRCMFLYIVSHVQGIYTYQAIDYGDSKDFYRSVIDGVAGLVDSFSYSYWGYFARSDFPDPERYITDEELTILESIRENEGTEYNCEAIWQILIKRVINNKRLIKEGTLRLADLKSMIELTDYFLDMGLSELDDGSYYKLFFGDAKEFAPIFIDDVLADIDSVYWLEPFKPFIEKLKNINNLVHNENWPQNEIVFGRFLEWIDLYNILAEEGKG